MGKIEKEIKILNIDIEDAKQKLEEIGARFIGIKNQKIYTYDVPTIYHRFIESLYLIKSTNPLLVTTSKAKMKLILDEFVDLIDKFTLNEIYKQMNINNFDELIKLDPEEIENKYNECKIFQNKINETMINPNKWVRLRQSNDKVELTTKHILGKSNKNIQNVIEREISVSNLQETNELLESIGLVRRNYQEKIRHSYKYKEAEIEIDEWPNLEPYIEIECDDETIIEDLINKLNYKEKEIVSLNTEQLYKNKGINVLEISDLKF